ncbi:MAG: hypothetical protein ACM3JI_03700, partial [Anaerolineae bacterium]
WAVEEYLKEYSSGHKTKNDPRGGSNPKLTAEESNELERHLGQITYLKVKPITDLDKIAFLLKEKMAIDATSLVSNVFSLIGLCLFFTSVAPAVPFLFLALSFSLKISTLVYQDFPAFRKLE